MRKILKLATMATLSSMLVLAGGCGSKSTSSQTDTKSSAESQRTMKSLMEVIRKQASSSECQSYRLNVDIDSEIEFVDSVDSTYSLSISNVTDIESDGINAHAYSKSTSIEDNVTTTEESDTYFMKEDGELLTKYEKFHDSWYKYVDSGYSYYDIDFQKLTDIDFSKASLVTTDDEYIVTVQMPFDSFNEAVTGETDAPEADSGAENADPVIVDVEYHFDKDKHFTSILSNFERNFHVETGEGSSSEAVIVETSKFVIKISNLDFSAKTIVLPEEASTAQEVTAEQMESEYSNNINTAAPDSEPVPAETPVSE